MSQRQLGDYAHKWLLDSFYNSIANGSYASSRVSEEKSGYFHKRTAYSDLLATLYNNKKKVLKMDEAGFSIDEQIETGFRDKEVLATMYDNMKDANRLDDIGISYDMQAKLGFKFGKHFQSMYDKTEDIERFVEKNDIPPILLTAYLMQKGKPEYLIAEGNEAKTSNEISKMQGCSHFLQMIIPSMMAGVFSGEIGQNGLPDDIGRIIGEKLVEQSSGSQDFRTLVKLSEVNKGAMQALRNR